ncbi:unnamed protein product [Rotaria socialis]|uniref:TNF receptor-associated factor n=1 Tax=Rotaria socialis TaxID=392032 RepID=A0A819X2S0_9BILA|nr:unnamed protein product [Rotaria socialis]CAF3319849.1 unnamed protein product [Rotaria socialis]CAF3474643.1 unnamed protein product [Rotaria socialis]CAF4135665.1 unnamed protein product [Rotaria socialis]CAF4316060.1 unnamed protein product [Rotaria socialis]
MSMIVGLNFRSISLEMQQNFLCSACHCLLIEPKVITCGHRYCSLCLKKIIENDPSTMCIVDKCGQTITNDEVYTDFGIENDLKRLTDVMCSNKSNGCSWLGNYITYKEHLQVCTFQRIQCEFCAIHFTNRLSYEQHYQLCPKVLISCPLKKYGCDSQIRRESLEDHVVSSSVEHLKILAGMFSSVQNQPMPIYSQPVSIHSFSTSISENGIIQSVKNELIQQNQIIEQLRLEEKSLQSKLLKRERDLTRVSVELQLFKGELYQLRKEFELSKSSVHNDGTYLWRIDNIQQLFRNAKNSSQPLFIVSPSFYTSKYGYRLSLKLYLNGDKTTQDKYLSLYVTMMRGEYDSLLDWPFKYPITLCLYDRSAQKDHVVHTVTPDLDSESFKQPKMDANKSGGIPEFCPLWRIFNKEFGYVQQDTMYVKAFVDFNIYPAKIWPQWTKLQSQGLPNNVEHMKLKELLDTKK